MTFQNVYTLRKVAENAAKSCEVCFKPSSSVLITAENKDFFYICPSHLKDKGFASPVIDKAAEEAKKKKKEEEEKEEKLKEEVERVKREYEEKKKKKEKEKKDGKDEKDKDKEKKKDEREMDSKDDRDKDDKDDKKDKAPNTDEPRVFALQKFVYQQRLEKRRQIEIAKRNRERMAAPGYFPSVPKGAP